MALIYRRNCFIFVYMETLIVLPKTKKQLSAIKAVLKALDVSFRQENDRQYNSEFVAKIQQGDEDFKAGKGKKITIDELNSLWK